MSDRAILQWSGWIVQQYNSASVAMGALGKELSVFLAPLVPPPFTILTLHRFTLHKPYYLVSFSIFIGLLFPIPFWLIHRYAKPGSFISRAAAYIHTPIVALYVGYLPYSVNGQWW